MVENKMKMYNLNFPSSSCFQIKLKVKLFTVLLEIDQTNSYCFRNKIYWKLYNNSIKKFPNF